MMPDLDTWRCPNCSRILAKIRLEAGSLIEIKCGSCNRFSVRSVDPPPRIVTYPPTPAIVGTSE